MLIAMIKNYTRIVGKEQGYLGLPIRDEKHKEGPVMVTAWEPTPDEIVSIIAGAKIEIKILGTAHPPIIVSVGDTPS